MKAKRWIAVGLICLGVNQTAFAQDAGSAVLDAVKKLQEQLAQQQQQLARQQAEIQALRTQLESQQAVSPATVNDIVKTQVDENLDQRLSESGLAQLTDSAPLITLGKAIDSLKIKSNLRLRYEQRDRDNVGTAKDDDRDRFRTQFRLGGVWTNETESWEVGAGLATGEESSHMHSYAGLAAGASGTTGGGGSPGSSGATSTNDTWSSNTPFENGALFLDYAYAKHAWDTDAGKIALTLGQQKNPFAKSWLLWDSDVRPAGATAAWKGDALFVTGGAYDVIQYGNNMGGLFAGQVGATAATEAAKLMVAVAYYHFNSNVDKALGTAGGDPNFDYEIADLYVKADVPVGEVNLSLYGEIFLNLGADGGQSQQGPSLMAGGLDPEEEDTGWLLGVDAKLGKLKLGYAYAQVEADAAPVGLKDADFGASGIGFDTDLKGHVITVGYSITKNFALGFEADLMEALERNGQRESNLYQLDLKYKF